MSETMTVAPVVKSVHVKCGVANAFEVFTRGIGSWWPLDQLALAPGEVKEVVWEEREGGEVYEISNSGERSHWATVLEWEPPAGFTIAWKVDPDAAAATRSRCASHPRATAPRSCWSTGTGTGSERAQPRRGATTTAAGRWCSAGTSTN